MISDWKTQKERQNGLLKLKLLCWSSVLNAWTLLNLADTHTHTYTYIYICVCVCLGQLCDKTSVNVSGMMGMAIKAMARLQLNLERMHRNLFYPPIGYIIRWLIYFVLLSREVHNHLSTHWNIRSTFPCARFKPGSSVCSMRNKGDSQAFNMQCLSRVKQSQGYPGS